MKLSVVLPMKVISTRQVPLGCISCYKSAHTILEQYQQFTSGIMISHACEDDMMFTCTHSVYRRPETDNT